MKALILLFVLTSMVSASHSMASTKKKAHKVNIASLKNIELWCGVPSHGFRNDFPYLAAIRSYKGKTGKPFETVTIYRNGKPVMKNYVIKTYQGPNTKYQTRDEDFSLNLPGFSDLNGDGNFRAVIHQRDGDTLVENGQFPCHRQKS